jgi:hypothetical protein
MSRTEYRAGLFGVVVSVVVAAGCAGGGDASAHAGAAESLGCTLVGDRPSVADSSAPTEDVRRGRTYRCVVHPGRPDLQVALIGDSSENRIVRIEVRRVGDAAPFQTLIEDEEESPYRGAEFFAGRDLDNDGYLDLLLLSNWGVTGNRYYRVWRWTPTHQRFVFDSTLSALSSPTPLPARPCVHARANLGDAGMSYEAVTLCLENGAWSRVDAESQKRDERLNAFVREVRERRGKSLLLTHVDTVRDSLR